LRLIAGLLQDIQKSSTAFFNEQLCGYEIQKLLKDSRQQVLWSRVFTHKMLVFKQQWQNTISRTAAYNLTISKTTQHVHKKSKNKNITTVMENNYLLLGLLIIQRL